MIHLKFCINDDDGEHFVLNRISDDPSELAESLAHAVSAAVDTDQFDPWTFFSHLIESYGVGMKRIGKLLSLLVDVCKNAPDDALTNFVVKETEIKEESPLADLARQRFLLAEDASLTQALREIAGTAAEVRRSSVAGKSVERLLDVIAKHATLVEETPS